jgi:hypothetical protein
LLDRRPIVGSRSERARRVGEVGTNPRQFPGSAGVLTEAGLSADRMGRYRGAAHPEEPRSKEVVRALNAIFSSTGFLRYGGIILLVVGVAGLVGLPGQSFWALTDGEDIAAIVFTIWPLILPSGGAFTPPDRFANPNFYGLANLESPMDAILHLVVAAYSGLALLMERRTVVTAPAGGVR